MKTYKHTIYFALSTEKQFPYGIKPFNKETLKLMQLEKILKQVVETFNGYSLIEMKGGYLDKETNEMIEETSYKLEILQDVGTMEIEYLCTNIKDIAKQTEVAKKYNTILWISLPDKPGQLGNVSSLIGQHKLNISNLEMVGKNPNYINFKFKLIIRNLKNFTNFIAELKQKSIKFKIIRHEEKRNAFTQKILKYFKKN